MNRVTTNMETQKNLIQLRNFIAQTFPLARRRTVTDSDNLLESGIIDSLGVLELVTFLQQEFSLAVDDDELTPENFQSIQAIAHFVEQRRQAHQELAK
jgi:acyl carrier protein